MFSGPRDGTFILWIAVAAGLLIVGFVAWQGAYSKGYNAANQSSKSDYANYEATQKNYSKCLDASTTIEIARVCFSNSPKASAAENRAQDDLNAQREMAKWAEAMFWATIFASVIGVFGVFLVWQTLAAANEMNKITSAAFINDQRPWLSFDAFPNGVFDLSDKGTARIDIKLKIQNFGRMPAYNMSSHSRLVEDFFMHFDESIVDEFIDESVSKTFGLGKRIVIPGEEFDTNIGTSSILRPASRRTRVRIDGDKKKVGLILVIKYKDPASQKLRFTGQFYFVERDDTVEFGWRLVRYGEAHRLT